MKKLLVIMMTMFITISSVYASQAVEKKGNQTPLCKLFTQKAKAYKLNMRHDQYAEATLASYEKRAEVFCSKNK